ncbi:MAG TPA: tRNA (N6-isopentenyl adenosine(37)-C2)-methylthiotransferase MiaB [Clostridiales bacterium]|nr:tRNA (N6-isopentenyl adenosine(37)-C2)-methylthiotransferase MiaB [Clostridiales bacterium]
MSKETRELAREEITGQYIYMERVRELLAADGKTRYCYVETYGCQQNEADSEIIRGMAVEMGYALCQTADEADFIVLNTCAVRENAEHRVFGNLGALSHIKKKKPDTIIALCGCMAAEEHVQEKVKKSFPHVSLVISSNALWQLPSLLYSVLQTGRRAFTDTDAAGVIAEGLPKMRDRGVKGWLPIMYGCNNFCTYCIVPYVRGRERSRRKEEILADAQSMLSEGYKDITLLGQNVNSYGKDDTGKAAFPELLREVAALPGDFRIRFMTSHPKDASEELFAAMAESPKVAKHLHLPFQAGSDAVLKRMNRGYTAEGYLTLVRKARSLMPNLVLTSDVIVGFPGETEEDFQKTLDLIREVRYDALFTFLYSPRKGTPAAKMEDIVPEDVKKERFARLLDLQNQISAEIHKGYIGRTVHVLVDGAAEGKEDFLSARTDGGRLVVFPGSEDLIGQLVEVCITDSTTWSLSGRLAAK